MNRDTAFRLLRLLVREELELALKPVLAVLAHQVGVHPKHGADELLTRDDVSNLLKVDIRTLRRMVHAGDVPAPITLGDRTDRWRRSTIESFLRKKEKQALTSGLRRGSV